jgi:hypothetical protein
LVRALLRCAFPIRARPGLAIGARVKGQSPRIRALASTKFEHPAVLVVGKCVAEDYQVKTNSGHGGLGFSHPSCRLNPKIGSQDQSSGLEQHLVAAYNQDMRTVVHFRHHLRENKFIFVPVALPAENADLSLLSLSSPPSLFFVRY